MRTVLTIVGGIILLILAAVFITFPLTWAGIITLIIFAIKKLIVNKRK